METRIDFNTAKVAQDKKQIIRGQVQGRLDQLALKDSNLYVPRDVGTLADSGILGSKIGSGVLEWRTPYARYQYYEAPNKSKDKNPRASMKWFEVAKSKNKKNWLIMANKWYRGKS